jgi:hypothetical protein
MKSPFVPIPMEALHARLTGAGFRTLSAEVYELAHSRDPRYAVQVHVSLRSDGAVLGVSILATLTGGGDPIAPNAETLDRLLGDARADVLSRVQIVSQAGTAEEVLDRVIDGVREAYGALNRKRLSAGLRAQAYEVAVRGKRSDLRRRSG